MPSNCYYKILDNLHDGLYFVDRNRRITYWNKAAEQITGFSADEVLGTSCADDILTHVDDAGNNLCCGNCPLSATMDDQISRSAQVYLHHKQGQRVPVSVRVTTLTDEQDEIIGGIELFTDVSNHHANELRIKELEKLALIDHLTQLANRHYIERELAGRLEELRRLQIPFGVLFIDIDNFKQINDRYGHDIGDQVLKFISKTLVNNSRPFDLYGRWGGEEFIAIIRNSQFNDLATIGERVRMLIEKSYLHLDDHNVCVTISIGATMAHSNDTIKSLVHRADQQLYQSKNNGRNRLTCYE